MLKVVSKSVQKPLCILMNRFNEGIFPNNWKLANVIPIIKKGDISQLSNNRQVAHFSCIEKNYKKGLGLGFFLHNFLSDG